jgi:hypothetical protein
VDNTIKTVGLKVCNKCKEEKELTEFYKARKTKSGYKTICKKCELDQKKEYYKNTIKSDVQRYEIFKERTIKNYHKNKKTINKIRNARRSERYREDIEHREKIRISKNRRLYLKKSVPCTLTENEWEETLDFFKHSCAYCGERNEKLHQEHVIPVSKGGYYTKQNIIPACSFCNKSKLNRVMEDWYASKEYFDEARLKKIHQWIGFDEKNAQQQILLF